jgi:hypothetical protein
MLFRVVSITFVLPLLAASGAPVRGQEEIPSEAGRILDQLRSEDIGVRERAELALADWPCSSLPLLTRLAARESDLEVRARIGSARQRVALREADRLLGEGRVEESLRLLAAAVAADDPEEFVHRTKRAVEEEIRSWFPDQPSMDDYPRDFGVAARTIEDSFGAWGTAVLIDALAKDEEGGIPAVGILQEMGADVVPCLVRALAQGGKVRTAEACSVLYARVFIQHAPLDDCPGLSLLLCAVATDPSADRDVRWRSRQVLQWVHSRTRRRPVIPFGGASP